MKTNIEALKPKYLGEKMPKVILDQEKCVNCKTCISICPMGVYEDEYDFIKVVKEEDCIACMGCVAACPVEAIIVEE